MVLTGSSMMSSRELERRFKPGETTQRAYVPCVVCVVLVKLLRMQAVHQAAARNDVDALRALLDEDPGLLEKGVPRGGWSNEEWRPLNYASAEGALEAVRLLLDRGAVVYRPDVVRHESPLVTACGRGHAEVASLLLARGGKPLSVHLRSALVRAAFAGHVAVIRVLLKEHREELEDSNAVSYALGYACDDQCAQSDKVARVLLIEGGANPMGACEDYCGETFMTIAERCGNHELVELLKVRGTHRR